MQNKKILFLSSSAHYVYSKGGFFFPEEAN